MKKFKGISINGTRYIEDSKCPSCSSEVDKGGRLGLKQVKNYFLKCIKCKYTIRSAEVRKRQEKWEMSRRKKFTQKKQQHE